MEKNLVKKRKGSEDAVCDYQNLTTVKETTQKSTTGRPILVSEKCTGKISKPRLYMKDYMKLGLHFLEMKTILVPSV